MFCETCEKLICQQCTVKTHHGHNYNLISEVFNGSKGELEALLIPAEIELEKVTEAMDEYCKRKDEILAQKTKIEGEINDVMCQLEEALAAKKAELHSQLEVLSHVKLTALNVDKGKLHSMQTSLRSDLAHVRNITNHATEEELLLAKKSCHQMLKRSCSINAEHSKLQPQEKANMILKTDSELVLQSLQTLATVATSQECPSKCFASGEGLSQATVGKRSKTFVSVVDHDNKPCEEIASNEIQFEMSHINSSSEKLTGHARRRRGGKYEISYIPTIKGIHELGIYVNGYHIRDSPFQVFVKSTEKHQELVQVLQCAHKPCGVTLTHTGELLVTSNHSKTITVLRQTGEIAREFGVGNFADATVDDDGNVYATDADGNEILKFSPEGNLVGKHGRGVLKFDYPTGIAFNRQNKKLYVANSSAHEIQVLNNDFTLYKAFGVEGNEKKQFTFPSSVCCDSSGNVFVADCGNDRVQVFTAEGKFVRMFGKSGDQLGELKRPRGIATNAKGKLVYVSDSINQHISVFNKNGQFVRHLGSIGCLDSPRG